MCITPIFIKNPSGLPFTVSCGKCPECRTARQNSWYVRLHNESLNYPHSATLFCTLTYDKEHLPHDNGLDKAECQRFFKRLRINLTRKYGHTVPIKYFLSGEYGEKHARPHYHCILFGIPDAESQETYDLILKSWGNGIVDRKFLRDAALRYVSKYVVKEAAVPVNSHHFKINPISRRISNGRVLKTFNWYNPNTDSIIANNFILASRGLGQSFLTKQKIYEIVLNNHTFLKICGHKFNLPRYYINKIREVVPGFLKPKISILYPDRTEPQDAFHRFIHHTFLNLFTSRGKVPVEFLVNTICDTFSQYSFYKDELLDMLSPIYRYNIGSWKYNDLVTKTCDFLYSHPDDFSKSFSLLSVSQFLDKKFGQFYAAVDKLQRKGISIFHGFWGNYHRGCFSAYRDYVIDRFKYGSILTSYT
nr:MAG: replication initiator protein [Microvirus sp.]